MANFNDKIGIGLFLVIGLIVAQVESQFMFGNNKQNGKGHHHGGFVNPLDHLQEDLQNAFHKLEHSIPKWGDIFGEFSKKFGNINGLKIERDGSIHLSYNSLKRNGNTSKLIFDIIIKFLGGLFPRSETITLPSGLKLSIASLLSRLRRVFYLQDQSRLTDTDKEVLNYILTTLEAKGFKLLGFPSFGAGNSEPWLALWKLLHGSGGQEQGAVVKAPDGKPVTWEKAYGIILKSLNGRNSIVLPNGQRVTLQYLLRFLQNSGKSTKTPTSTEKAVWKYIWQVLQASGYSLAGDNADVTQLEFASEDGESSGPVVIEAKDGKPATLKSIALALEQNLGNARKVAGSCRYRVKTIFKTLRRLSTHRSPGPQEINVLICLWDLLQQHGFKISEGDGSWEGLREFLLQEIKKPGNNNVLKSLKLQTPKVSIPKIDFRSILNNVFKLGTKYKSFKIHPGGKIDIVWKKGETDVGELKLLLKVIFDFLDGILKETHSNTIKIANGLELTIPEIEADLQQALKLPNPRLLTRKQKAIVRYLSNLVETSGINIPHPKGHGRKPSWSQFFDILHTPKGSKHQLFDFNFKLPQIHWPKLPSFNFDFHIKLPDFDFEKILGKFKPAKGLELLPGGKFQISWKGGKFNSDAALAALKYLFGILEEIAKQSGDGQIDVGNGVKLSLQDIGYILRNSFKVKTFNNLDDNAKYVLDYLAKLLEKFGFSVTGLPVIGKKPLSEILWSILRTHPTLPGLNLPSTQSSSIIELPDQDFHQLWENAIGSGKPGLDVLPEGVSFTWQPGKSNDKALKVIWEFFYKLLLKAQEATNDGSIHLGNGIKLTANQFINLLQRSLETGNAGNLNDEAKIAWTSFWDTLQQSNFSIKGAPNKDDSPSWDLLYGLSGRDPELPNFNFLAASEEIQPPSISIPSFKFDSKLLDELKTISGFTISPNDKIQLQWQGGKFDPNILSGFWKVILNALNAAADKGTLDLGNGTHFTIDKFVSILSDATKVPNSQQLSLEQKNVLNYLSSLLNGNGFEIVGEPEDGEQPWQRIWDILNSQLQFPNFKLPSWPDDTVVVVLPSFQWPESGFPTLKFDAIWSSVLQKAGLIPGLTFLPNGKIVLSWQDGTFQPSTVNLIWEYILRVLRILQKYSKEQNVQLTNGITLTWDQIISDFEEATKKNSPDQFSLEEKAVFDFIGAIALKSGLEIAGVSTEDISKEIPFWVLLAKILHQQPNPPPVAVETNDASFVSLAEEQETTTPPTMTTETPIEIENEYTDDGPVETEVNLTDTEKQSLQTTLSSLNTQGDKAAGDVEIQGFTIPYSFIVSAANLKDYDLQTLSISQLRDLVLLYIKQADKPSDASGDVPADNKVTLTFILDYLQTEGATTNKTVVFEGQKIPVDFIWKILKIQGIDIQKTTPSVLYRIFLLYLNSNSKQNPVESNLQSVLETLRKFLAQNGYAAAGSILMNGHQISIQQVIALLKTQNIDVKTVTSEELWRAIQLIFSTQDANSPPIDQKTFVLNYFLGIFKHPESVLYSTLVFNNVNVSVASILNCLGIQQDPDTGTYNTDDVTKDDLWTCLQSYVADHSHVDTSERITVFKEFLEIISNPANIQNSVLTIIYNGSSISIPIPALVDSLDLQINNVTGKYDVGQLTPDIVWQLVQKFFPGAQQKEVKQSTLEYFINAISDPANVENGVLIVSGGSSNKEINIPLAKLVADLGLKIDKTGKYDVSGLTADAVWAAIQKYLQ